jgi:hypothetical protein
MGGANVGAHQGRPRAGSVSRQWRCTAVLVEGRPEPEEARARPTSKLVEERLGTVPASRQCRCAMVLVEGWPGPEEAGTQGNFFGRVQPYRVAKLDLSFSIG